MPEIVYVLCAITSLLCFWLLLRGFQRSGSRLLLWSAICFAGMTVNNVMVYVDLVLLPTQVSLALFRGLVSVSAVLALIYGFVWEVE